MATILELAELSNFVYGGASATAAAAILGGVAANATEASATGAQWTLLTTSQDPSNAPLAEASQVAGYYGAAYINNRTGEIVIANRGTRPTALADLFSDIELATGVESKAQDAAAAFALSIANNQLYSGKSIIETGHSLGGNEAQAAVVALTTNGTTVSAVTFNSPGIGGYPVPAGVSYTVQNFYDQGDAIHLAGGTQLGSPPIMLPAGPNTSALALGMPVAVAAGPLGMAALLGDALWDVVGPAHSINTIIAYLQGNALGAIDWTATGPSSSLPTTTSGNDTGPTMSVNNMGALVLTYASGDSVILNESADKKNILATFSGSSSPIVQQLAAMGTVTIPLAELNQSMASLTTVATINETISRNADNTFGVIFQNTGVSNSGDQFKVSVAANADSAFDYVVPTNGQAVLETINNGNSISGTVAIISDTGTTQLTGGTMVAGSDNTWVDSNGDQYVFDPTVGTLTITQGLLGDNGNQIVIDNFDMSAAQTNVDGYLGIKFEEQVGIQANALAANPFVAGVPADQTTDVANGNTKTFTIYASSASSNDQIVQLALSGGTGTYAISTGATLLPFSGSLNFVIPAGQDQVSFTLVDLGNSKGPDTAQLTASLVDADGNAVNSNNLTITFDNPSAGAGTAVTPDATINGDLIPVNFGTTDNPQYKVDNLGNIITNGSAPGFNDTLFGSSGNDLINTGGGNNYVGALQGGNDTIVGGSGNDTIFAGNGNNIISGNGGQDNIVAGSGNNQIYANQQTDLATALNQAKTATPTGVTGGSSIYVNDGNNTIIGGNGNDDITMGAGNNVVVCGPGSVSVLGGVDTTVPNNVTSTTVNEYGLAYTNDASVTEASAPFDAPANYNGSTFNGVPVGLGNDTIFGGTGNSVYWLSNGNNYLDAGGGNDYIQAGVGNNTIFGGIGNDTIHGGGGNNYIDLESGNDSVAAEGGNTTIIGGSGNDTIYSGDSGSGFATSETSANNYIYGGSGNSAIYGSGGNDTLLGGTGNTSIYGGNGNEYIVGGSGNVSIVGGNGTDTIYAGGNGNDTIYAGDGNATVYGGDGTDIIVGGAGMDNIQAGDGGTADAATQLYAGSGTSTLYGGAGVDQLIGGTGTDTLVAGTGTSTLQGGTGTEVMYSSIGNATLIAGTGSDTLYGGGGTDWLQGNSGDALFVAGSGIETIYGGTGNNTYQFNDGFGNVALLNATGADTFQFGSGISLADLTITATIDAYGNNALEIDTADGSTVVIDGGLSSAISQFAFADGTLLTRDQLLTQASSTSTEVAGTNGNLVFSANSGDFLTGGTGSDTIYGYGAGQSLTAGTGDQHIYGTGADQLITGGAGNDTLIGLGADDTLVAGSGWATLIGGTGNETFVINNVSDIIQAQSTGTNVNTVMSSVNYAAGANIQNITLTGDESLVAMGNTLNNVMTANNGNDTLIAGSGNDTLIGGSGQNTYEVDPGFGNVVIQPGSVGDTLLFGTGITLTDLSVTGTINDAGQAVLVIDVATGGSVSIVGGLADALDNFSIDGTTYSLQQLMQMVNIVPVVSIGAAGDLILSATAGDTLTGTGGNDTIEALGANTSLIGGGGDTTFIVNDMTQVVSETNSNVNDTILTSVSYVLPANVQALTGTGNTSLTLTGNDLNDVITANLGSDTLIAGSGLATLVGGMGGDTFIVNNGADVILASANTYNIVQSSVSYVMPENVQSMLLTGRDDLTATGNDQNNTIQANSGNDTLIAGAGLVTLIGGTGNDTFIVNNTADVVQAQVSGVSNTILTSVSYVAPDNVQNLTGTGNADIRLNGDSQSNMVVTANTGNDTLRGGSGSGTLVGGSGLDTFVLAAVGNYTAIKMDASDAIVQLDPGFDFTDVTAVQSGNDLLLQIGGGSSSLLLQNYFLDPQNWTIQDNAGNTTTAQALLDATAQESANTLTTLENQFLIRAKAGYIQQLVGQGYTQLADGSWSATSMYGSVGAQYEINNSNTSWGDFNPTTGMISYSTPVTQQTKSWSSNFLEYIESAATIQQMTTDATGSTIYANTGSYSSTYAAVWFSVNWNQSLGSPSYKYSYGTSPMVPDVPVSGVATSSSGYVSTDNGNYYWEDQWGTNSYYNVSGTISGGMLFSPGNLTTTGAFAQLIAAGLYQNQTTDVVQQINVEAGDHTVYASSATLVNSGSGNNTIYGAGFVDAGTGNDVIYDYNNTGTVYCESGNDTIYDAASVYGGSGNDTIYGAQSVYGGTGNELIVNATTVVAGSGNDTIIGSGPGNITINADISGMDLIGNVENQDFAFLNAYYQAQGISDGLERYQYGGLYLTNYSSLPSVYNTAEVALDMLNSYGADVTLQQALDNGWLNYINPLSSIVMLKDGAIQPADYYSAGQVPITATFAANDFTALAPYFGNSSLPAETVTFGAGISLSSLQFTWGQVTTALSGVTTDPQQTYTTLDMTWGANQGIEVVMPHMYDPIGSGVQEFVFADGTTMSMADMIALAPSAPSFDPEIFNFKQGMGQQILPSYAQQIAFATGIDFSALTLTLNGSDIILGNRGGTDTLTIPDGVSNPAVMPNLQFTFADSSTMVYSNDGLGDVTLFHYDLQGNFLGDSWIYADGRYGSDAYNSDGSISHSQTNADGSGSGSTTNADGSYSNYTLDTQGNLTVNNYSSSSILLSSAWSNTDGSYTDTIYNADGSGSYTWGYADGSHGSEIYNADGSGSDTWTGADGSYGSDTYNADGSSTSTTYNPDGSYSNITYNADGSNTGTNYNPDGSYTNTTDNGLGLTSAYNYAADGTLTNYSWSSNDGQGLTITDTYAADGTLQTDHQVSNDGNGNTNDTLTQADGSYQNSWTHADGSYGTAGYIAATGETLGTNHTAGTDYVYGWDQTTLANGSIENKTSDFYTDGSSYNADTVTQTDGSYQETWQKSDGSYGTAGYVAATGETLGTNHTAGTDYLYSWDTTLTANGSTDTKTSLDFTNGYNYSTETLTATDGSYQQAWTTSDGTAGSTTVDASGTQTGDSWLHADGTQGIDAAGNQLLLGSAVADVLVAGNGNALLIGGAGNDQLTLGSGNDIIGFDIGDGQDTVIAGSGQNNTLALGGALTLDELSFSRSGNDLVLGVDAADSVTFKDWYAATGNQSLVTLQVLAEAMPDYAPGSSDVLRNMAVETFDFKQLVAAFDQASAANPTLSAWSLSQDLLTAHLSGSDSAMLGGDLAYNYGQNGSLAGSSVLLAQGTISSAQFGTAAQSLQPGSANAGIVSLAA
ncbi:MAG: DUF2974 domain-containing protein [Sulfuriferula sp.]|nr:DUF2974 domain-containing protein [Sulfuriferula sp.]